MLLVTVNTKWSVKRQGLINWNVYEMLQAGNSRNVVGDPAENGPDLLQVCGPFGRQMGGKVFQRPAERSRSLANKREKCKTTCLE